MNFFYFLLLFIKIYQIYNKKTYILSKLISPIWCLRPDLNRHGIWLPQDFKSCASTNFATQAHHIMTISLYYIFIYLTILFFNFQYLFLIFRKFSYYLYRFQHFLRHSYQKQIILSYLMYLYLLFFDSNFHIMTH